MLPPYTMEFTCISYEQSEQDLQCFGDQRLQFCGQPQSSQRKMALQGLELSKCQPMQDRPVLKDVTIPFRLCPRGVGHVKKTLVARPTPRSPNHTELVSALQARGYHCISRASRGLVPGHYYRRNTLTYVASLFCERRNTTKSYRTV